MKTNFNNRKVQGLRYKLTTFIYSGAIFILLFAQSACEEFIAVDSPKSQISSAAVYNDDLAAKSAVIGIYSRMMQTRGIGNYQLTLYGGLSADEFINYQQGADQSEIYANSIAITNVEIAGLWSNAYQFIYHANVILEGLASSRGVTPEMAKQFEGEARFIRAFCHFYLVNLWGDVPLITTTDYRVNSIAPRASKEEVYDQIIADLIVAKNLMGEDYSISKNERTRPNKWAATALLARAYLYINNWTSAEEQSTEVINQVTLFNLESDLKKVFLANSKEAIWQVYPVLPNPSNTLEGSQLILSAIPQNVQLTTSVLKAFEPGDSRYLNWVNSITLTTGTYYYPFKYKIRGHSNEAKTEYNTVLRLAEQYLIRAEARLQLGNILGAKEDLSIIRNRAGLSSISADNKADLLLAIEQERRIEFFAEWGHRWLDLKRWDSANNTLQSVKSNWNPTDTLYPIPQTEREKDTNLTQNPGY